MGYIHAKEEAKFRKEWVEKLRFYKAHGMTMAQILEIYKFDRAVFNSDRRYYEHCHDIPFEESNPKFSVDPELAKYSEDDWMEVLDPALSRKLAQLPKEQLKAFYLYRVFGYTQDEVSAILLKPQRTISFWISKIAEIIMNFKNDC